MSVLSLGKSVKHYFNYRRRFESIPGFTEFYNTENQKFSINAVRTLCSLGVVLYSAVGILDYTVFTEHFPLFISLRIVFALVTGTSLLLTFTKWGKAHALHLVFVSALFGELLISFMISQLSGWSSLYFVGNILITNAVTMFIPWRPRVNALYCALSLLGYICIVGFYHPFAIEMAIPVTFMFANNINSFFSSLASESGRMSQWASVLKIERQHEELIRLNETKERFFANISHELRTPLTLVISPLGALAKRGGGWVSQELVASMVSNAQRLLRQVNSLLDLGKIDSQEMKIHLEVGNLKDLLVDLHRASVPGAYERGINIEIQTPPAIANSKFDFEKVETILANLISNAIKFTPPRGHIVLSCELKNNGYARLSVRDTGPGIPLEEQEKVFERFHQVEGANKEASKGTGLGLSVAKELIELHNGKIWFESVPKQGTTFFVEIPFLETKEPVADAFSREELRVTLLSDIARGEAASEIILTEENKRRMQQRRKDKPVVLYVDDSGDLRRYVDSILSGYYTVLLAEDGERGLAEAVTYHPDLILCDVMMPKMDGFEMCKRVREDATLKSTPLVLLTANSSLDAKIEGLEGGADDYLNKPFSERELLVRLKNLISLQEKSRELKQQMEAAKRLQMMLLPPLTQTLQGVKIEAIYRASNNLSANFFDTVAIGKWIYVYLAEVAGRGLAAAQVTYLVREIFKNTLIEEMDLDVLFDRVRRAYVARFPEFDLNLQMMRMNSLNGEVEYLRTNAAKPALLNEKCEIQEVEVPQTPAISPLSSPSKYKTGEVIRFKLARNTKLYSYSEGAYHFKLSSQREFGHGRLLRTFAGTHILEWPEGLTETLQSENDGQDSFSEDITILRISFQDSTWSAAASVPFR
ncbi:hypothetical protein AZI86_17570 [Bdellovibrio bacteriovorus]|uniref:histidine kinase n=1 Tax=Bdellovibrio bacteriovorus TaxID=959 RepID=A0A150WEJ6_BDEBC|nr:ATP-binding protein [Bdellovibrio bacteriovorus]KYG61517.1 hypothetical protein AZI86_17570 [Bdellovibrio bacteriovorus]